MQRALIVSGVLGAGTALVFGAAALTALLFPNGTQVAGSWNGAVFVDRGVQWAPAPPMMAPAAGGATIELPSSAPESP